MRVRAVLVVLGLLAAITPLAVAQITTATSPEPRSQSVVLKNPKAQIPNPKSQIPNPKSQILRDCSRILGSWIYLYVVRISENRGSAPRLGATGNPSSWRTVLVPCTSATIL